MKAVMELRLGDARRMAGAAQAAARAAGHAVSVAVCDAAHRDVSGSVRCTWPSAHEVAITFALAPPVGTIYQVECVAS